MCLIVQKITSQCKKKPNKRLFSFDLGLLYDSPICLCVILPICGWDIWKLGIIKTELLFCFQTVVCLEILHRWITLTAAFTDANSTTALPLFLLDIRMFRTSPYCNANIITAHCKTATNPAFNCVWAEIRGEENKNREKDLTIFSANNFSPSRRRL